MTTFDLPRAVEVVAGNVGKCEVVFRGTPSILDALTGGANPDGVPALNHSEPSWLTTADVQQILGLGDPRTARRMMRELGAVKVGLQYRLPPERLDQLRAAQADPNFALPLNGLASTPRRFTPSPMPGAVLEGDWWKAANHG